MNKEKKVVIFDKRKIELMKEIRKQIESIRKNLVMLQSGNGGELTETMDDIVFEVRRANSQLDGMLERTIDFHKKYI